MAVLAGAFLDLVFVRIFIYVAMVLGAFGLTTSRRRMPKVPSSSGSASFVIASSKPCVDLKVVMLVCVCYCWC